MGVAIAQENTVASTRTLSTGINGMSGYFAVCVQYCQHVAHKGVLPSHPPCIYKGNKSI